MSAHTPGPWTISHGKIVGNGYNIASINSSATSEGKANALIMAAAIDMFEALQGFVNHGSCFDESDMQKARAAIAKSTGQ